MKMTQGIFGGRGGFGVVYKAMIKREKTGRVRLSHPFSIHPVAPVPGALGHILPHSDIVISLQPHISASVDLRLSSPSLV